MNLLNFNISVLLQNLHVPNIIIVNILNDIRHLVILLGKLKLKITNSSYSIWHLRVELYNIFLQHVRFKTSKRKLFWNHDSAKALLGFSFIMCVHIFLFLFELNNYVTSFVVEAIVFPFKYIADKPSMIFTRYTTPIFFPFVFLSHIPITYVSKTVFSVVILELILDL